jgi:hypothetical protein
LGPQTMSNCSQQIATAGAIWLQFDIGCGSQPENSMACTSMSIA